jgi:putative membrane protein
MSDLNDPRVLFAAELTLLAWNRTCISLMAFVFVVERFGLFLQLVGRDEIKVFRRHISFVVGEAFVVLAAVMAVYSIWQHKTILKSIRPAEIPTEFNLHVGMVVNALIGLLGLALSLYLARGFLQQFSCAG